ncbi:UDP-N-acetylmuramoyl-tripeptide--D-alanyl-D-alanine ligase [Flavobacterium sp. UBA6135]|uniref:UDP-N-acetylmuramoyl-tripeptide--D-alanyl-D- alanine ligase n=1 Tax=Flavobacterium sp. UBA6135 TaxID=1946553 RepID=UPI0025C66607|nr:UDP-N-acetylmuramoyl-tripeptide--D-alanyl-D-alanine ligase [Flavobacterium sp. UBA6135]
MEISQVHTLFLKTSSVSIDTRKIEKNSFFIALKGENFNANTFAKEALEKGAKYVVIDEKDFYIDERTILVDNCLETLQNLATFHRDYLQLPIIALTGSNGKTTTKELIFAVLSKKYKTKATIGNLNNHIGVPLTLLSFDKETEIGIVEMGANHQKEIAFLCQLAKPDYGYITNFGKAHLEGFGGVEGVIKGKSEMYDYLFQHDKKVVVNLDDPIQNEKAIAFKNSISFSSNITDAFVFASDIVANPFATITIDSILIKSNLIGIYNASNIIAAITIGKYFGVSIENSRDAISSYFPENNRSQILFKNTNQIILDAYNANPSSMEVAIKNFIQLDNANKIMILGDMFELGEESFHEHKMIVSYIKSSKANLHCYFVGNEFYAAKVVDVNFSFYKSFDEFKIDFETKEISDSLLLIKGSRGMALERVLNYL